MGTEYDWQHVREVKGVKYKCGFCGVDAGPSKGYYANLKELKRTVEIFICPACSMPTFVSVDGRQFPGPRGGRDVSGITDAGVAAVYQEARDCTGVGAFTGAVLLCRKLLMNLAVEFGAKPGLNFTQYVDHLVSTGHVPPNGKAWVDRVRTKGNEATHEIAVMNKEDAAQLLTFSEMLLRFNFEFPTLLEPKKEAT